MYKKTFVAVALAVVGGMSIAQAPAPAPAGQPRPAGSVPLPVQGQGNTTPPLVTLPRTPSPTGVKLYIVSPADGATVKSPVTVVFGLSGMGIAPAGTQAENTGHHHLLVDADLPANVGLPLPTTDNIRHFGKGQTEATIELKPGKHTLQLVLGDHMHVPFLPVVASPKITITVQ
jgi:hypothetical protein